MLYMGTFRDECDKEKMLTMYQLNQIKANTDSTINNVYDLKQKNIQLRAAIKRYEVLAKQQHAFLTNRFSDNDTYDGITITRRDEISAIS